MKQVLLKKGEVIIEEVPAPVVEDGTVLVQVGCSCISAGTEISGMDSSGEPLWKKAMKQPDKVKNVWKMLQTKGVSSTVDNIKSKVYASRQTGYSCSGVVVEVGENVSNIKAGDKVACAGAGYANHAEIVNVPRNLVVKVPESVSLELAATTTLGAIALQGVRRASPTLGETVVVLGLGILGQFTVQLLRVNGCRAIGVDINQERVELAKSLGMEMGIYPIEDPVQGVFQLTHGFGADAVIVTAATKSDEVISQAFQMCRKKGRVVLVGDVGLNIKRSDIYTKELDFFISMSYGPGRYESNYEEKGLDYPISYVRWTENRNMQEYLRLLAEGRIQVKPLITKEYSIEQVSEAYRELKESVKKPLIVLLKYSLTEDQKASKFTRKVEMVTQPAKKQGRINIVIIGAGSFAKSVHLPNLQSLSKLYIIRAIVSATGSNAKETAKQFGAAYCTTDYRDVLTDDDVDMVMICTRHNLHTRMAVEAAKAGKAVFLEKPMALNQEELDGLVKVLQETKVPFTVGFNRRFSPAAMRAKELIKERQNPIIVNYRVNAGYIPPDHWVHSEEGGGRIIGEACHMFDLFNFFTESEVESVDVSAISPKTDHILPNDNFVATLKYTDGSVCTLIYTALGASEIGKEYIEIYCDNKTMTIDDFKEFKIYGAKQRGWKGTQDKGHLKELEEFGCSICEGRPRPIPLDELIRATEISFIVARGVRK